MKNRYYLLIKLIAAFVMGISLGLLVAFKESQSTIPLVVFIAAYAAYYLSPSFSDMLHYKDETETIADLQKFVDECEEWANMVFPHANSESCIRHLKEELGEILEVISTHQASHIDHEDIEKQEFADSMLLHLQAIKRRDISLTDLIAAMRKKMEINRQRKWKKTENGYWKHTL